ncbi:MAG TPA: 8-amino-7-oxononanoate synthase [Rhodanobacteraceae bacterium]|nr:8-amino-7-oxononanoate synthase [Rhodanobacteraceae bacterium]
MNRPDLLQRMAAASRQRGRDGLHRQSITLDDFDGVHGRMDGQTVTSFCSNDYLGLAHHPVVIDALQTAAARCGVGSTGSHLISGHRREHAQLEEDLADWTGRERALVFSSGMMANLGVMQALLARGDACVQDKLNHASLIDAAHTVGATLKRYPHADVQAAARQLAATGEAAALIATDGVFSMDGDVAPLAELAALAARENATLMVDDAHGLGVVGPGGSGSVRAANLTQNEVPVLMGTLGKALGCHGAFVAGSASLIDGLVQFARSYIYTTALPPALAAAARAAVAVARHDSERRDKLAALIDRFRHGAAQLGLPVMPSSTPIQPLLLGDSARTEAAQNMLADAGFLVVAIRPPTVPANRARLRITLSAGHADEDVDRLLDALAAVSKRILSP